jgi:hypothetical protein
MDDLRKEKRATKVTAKKTVLLSANAIASNCVH